jgi:hypothetical protein
MHPCIMPATFKSNLQLLSHYRSALADLAAAGLADSAGSRVIRHKLEDAEAAAGLNQPRS